MTLYQMKRGAEIFAKYFGDDYDGDFAKAGVIYGPPHFSIASDNISPGMSADDEAELESLGWRKGVYRWLHA